MQGHRRVETLAQHLAADHERLTQVLEDVRELARRKAFAQAVKRFGAVRGSFKRHLALQDRILLPLLEEHSPAQAGRAAALRAEHAQLSACLESAARCLGAWEEPSCHAALERLASLLRDHHRRDAENLSPALDGLLHDSTHWQTLLRRAGLRF